MAYTVRNNFLLKDGNLANYRQSPNHGGSMKPRLIVIHYTADNSLEGALSWLCSSKSKVSAHLVIAKDGTVYQLLPFDIVGWHAGSSSYGGSGSVNAFAIGIENVGVGDVWPAAQVRANRDVIAALCEAYPEIEDIVGHSDVAPGRKVDPGPRYPWGEVTDMGVEPEMPEFVPVPIPVEVTKPAPKKGIIDIIRGWLRV
jgi:N-acetylmuramoyl-L-alanine amidase